LHKENNKKEKMSLTKGLFAAHILAVIILGLSAIVIGVLVKSATTNETKLTLVCYGETVFSKSSNYLKWLLPVFPALSVVNHVVSLSTWDKYLLLLNEDAQGPVVYRWVEYALSASVMLWLIGQLSGVQELPTLVTLCLANVALQATGYMIEKTGDKGSAWTIMGYALFVILFATILPYFFGSLAAAKNANVQIPGAVYSVVIIELLLFLSFGIVSTYFCKNDGESVETRKKREVAYVCLSITAKTLLAWLVYGGCLNIPSVTSTPTSTPMSLPSLTQPANTPPDVFVSSTSTVFDSGSFISSGSSSSSSFNSSVNFT